MATLPTQKSIREQQRALQQEEEGGDPLKGQFTTNLVSLKAKGMRLG